MTRLARQQRKHPLLAVCLVCGLSIACREEVPLGAWDLASDTTGQAGATSTVATTTTSTVGTTGTGGGAGAASDGGEVPPPLPACLEAGTPGPLNAPGVVIGATETATDWTWPEPVDAVQFDLRVEREIARDPNTIATVGYYYAYQFSLLEGAAGFLGIQEDGIFTLNPDDPPAEQMTRVTKMAVFWLSGSPLAAELGDITGDDARIADITASGIDYVTIHAVFDWEVCRTYRLRVGPESTESDGSIWYGAWIEDVDAESETFLGRMHLPADSGQFSPFSISRTYPIEYVEPGSCDLPAEGSVLYGAPHSIDGEVRATVGTNRFAPPVGCSSSRFTEFEGAVRHELRTSP